MTHPGFFLDGRRAGRIAAMLEAEAGDLLIRLDPEEPPLRWPLGDIRALRDQGSRDRLILRLPGDEARLVLEAPAAIAWALTVCPALGAHVRDPLGRRRILGWGAAAAVSVALLVVVVIPRLAAALAPLIPAEAEAALGRQIRDEAGAFFGAGPAEARYCTGRAGLAALDTMVAALMRDADLPYQLDLAVIASDEVNAFAAPGGVVVVLSGLIDSAGSAEEVAAVLAHEIGHVAHRDPTRLALSSAGTGAVLGLAVGDVLGATALAAMSQALVDARYARGAEAAADAYAAERLAAAGVSPAALATFFDRLAATSPDLPGVLGYFASHPDLADRSAAAREAAGAGGGRPVLSPSEWQALRAVCDQRGPQP